MKIYRSVTNPGKCYRLIPYSVMDNPVGVGFSQTLGTRNVMANDGSRLFRLRFAHQQHAGDLAEADVSKPLRYFQVVLRSVFLKGARLDLFWS